MAIGENQSSYDDPMYLSSSDHASMQLTTRQFDGNNYLGWARSARLALSTKSKLGFVTGDCSRPSDDSSQLGKWLRCDSMVNCWILNSLTADIAEGFSYLNSSKEVWNELKERYGQSNGPRLYQLKFEITRIKQHKSPVSVYYTKLKRVWDELKSIETLPHCVCAALKTCVCEVTKKLQALESRDQMLQFLMGLSDDYEQLRGQILGMDPLPSTNRVYYLVQQLEKQRQITGINTLEHNHEYEACAVSKPSHNVGTNARKESKKSKSEKFCNHCKQKGHFMEQCFKLHGYPDWFKGEKEKGTGRLAGQVDTDNYVTNDDDQDTPLGFSEYSTYDNKVDTSSLINTVTQTVTQEVMKALKLKIPAGSYEKMSVNPYDSQAAINFAGSYQ